MQREAAKLEEMYQQMLVGCAFSDMAHFMPMYSVSRSLKCIVSLRERGREEGRDYSVSSSDCHLSLSHIYDDGAGCVDTFSKVSIYMDCET